MQRSLYLSLLSLSFTLMLSSCTSWNAAATKRGLCNTLKSQVVFNGATSDTREANIQSAAEPLQQHTYDKDNCDQIT